MGDDSGRSAPRPGIGATSGPQPNFKRRPNFTAGPACGWIRSHRTEAWIPPSAPHGIWVRRRTGVNPVARAQKPMVREVG